MLIDVSDLVKGKKKKQEVHLEFQKQAFMDRSEKIGFVKPIKLEGELVRKDEFITFDGNMQTELLLTCSRCLERFNYNINLEINVKFAVNKDVAELDVYNVKNDSINLDDIIESNIISELPIKRLCSEECAGICPCCGANLNVTKCGCAQHREADKEDGIIDPRLAKLKNFFNN
jgi:uncharacterized protein